MLVVSLALAFSPVAPAACHLSSTATLLQAGFLYTILHNTLAETWYIMLKDSNAGPQYKKIKMDMYKTALKKSSPGGALYRNL